MDLTSAPQDLHALADAVDRLLGVSFDTGERTHIVVRREAPVARLGLALEPWSGMEGWIRAERLDAVLLHRPWRLPIDALPRELGVLASHAPFDERLGLGWNKRLADQMELDRLEPLAGKSGVPVGMLGTVVPMGWRVLTDRLAAIFGGIEESLGVPNDRAAVVTRIAVVRAMNGDLVGQAARAGADVYVTGELRPAARAAVLATGIAAVGVGHERAERWSLGVLAGLLAAEWPGLKIDLAPEGTRKTR